MSLVKLKLSYDQKDGGLRRILGVEFPTGRVVTVAPRVAGFVLSKYEGAKGLDVEVVEGEPAPWKKPERPDPRAWDELVRLPQADPERAQALAARREQAKADAAANKAAKRARRARAG